VQLPADPWSNTSNEEVEVKVEEVFSGRYFIDIDACRIGTETEKPLRGRIKNTQISKEWKSAARNRTRNQPPRYRR